MRLSNGIIGLAQYHLRCDGEDATAEVSQSGDATAEGTLYRTPEETVLCRFSGSGSGSFGCSTTAAMCQKNAELRIHEGEPGR